VIGLGFKARQPASSTRHEERPQSVVSSADRPIRDALLGISGRRLVKLSWQPGSALEWMPTYEGCGPYSQTADTEFSIILTINETAAEIRR